MKLKLHQAVEAGLFIFFGVMLLGVGIVSCAHDAEINAPSAIAKQDILACIKNGGKPQTIYNQWGQDHINCDFRDFISQQTQP